MPQMMREAALLVLLTACVPTAAGAAAPAGRNLGLVVVTPSGPADEPGGSGRSPRVSSADAPCR